MGKYLDKVRSCEARQQMESHGPRQTVSTLPPPAWPCSYCGKPAVIDEVCSSLDGQRTLTLWHCPPCQTYGVTPDAICQPPIWVKRKEQ